jgi:hypothetical protein
MNKAEQVVAAAREEWSRHVEEPPGKGWRRITDYIRDGLEWWRLRPKKRYTTNGSFLWCGAFASWCYDHAELKYSIRQKHLASCARLYRWSGRSKPNERRIEPHSIQPGDIIVVGPEVAPRKAKRRLRKKRPRWGRHICIAERPTPDGWATIEGNAHGQFPDGSYGEGVIRTERPYAVGNARSYRILYGIRPLAEDYDD